SGGWDRTLRLWDLAAGRCLRVFEGHAAKLTAVCLSPDGSLALSGGGNVEGEGHVVKLWEVGTGRCRRTFAGHRDRVTAACFGPDGRHFLSGSWDGTVSVWDLATGSCEHTLAGPTGRVTAACFGPPLPDAGLPAGRQTGGGRVLAGGEEGHLVV